MLYRSFRSERHRVWGALFGVALLGCNTIAGIEAGDRRDEGPRVACATLPECESAAPACARATGCVEHECIFEDEPAGTEVVPGAKGAPSELGYCLKLLCDGRGGIEVALDPTRVEDDGKECTEDSCNGITPKHEVLPFIACYEGAPLTRGVGACVDGVRVCDVSGAPVGPCVGQVVPKDETCLAPGDEDCNGDSNEGGLGCYCGDGYVSKGEICDDGNASSTDECTTMCAPAACGDGYVQAVAGESCDDGNTLDGDQCPADCRHRAISLDLGGEHACALREDGALKCWGFRSDGRIGIGSTSPDDVAQGDAMGEMGVDLPIVDLGAGKTVTQVAAGVSFTCVLLAGGSVKCFGENLSGQLGLGDAFSRGSASLEMGDALPAVDLGAGKAPISLTAGGGYSCAIFAGGEVRCWGENSIGQLGLGDKLTRGDHPGEMGDALPIVDLGAGSVAVDILAGGAHTCVLTSLGDVKCWGNNVGGQLGLGDFKNRGDGPGEMGDALPSVNLGQGESSQAVALGSGHTCALLASGAIKCWGIGYSGELGLGDVSPRGDDPSEMGDMLPAVDLGSVGSAIAVAAGMNHTCALLLSGAVKCWGKNDRGQLGLGDTANRGDEPGEMGDALPEVKLGDMRAIAIAAGTAFTCALLEDGRVKCWGSNDRGQLGLGDTLTRGDKPGEEILEVDLF